MGLLADGKRASHGAPVALEPTKLRLATRACLVKVQAAKLIRREGFDQSVRLGNGDLPGVP